MKNILIFIIAIAMSLSHANGAVRDGNALSRGTQKRVTTTPAVERTTTARTTVLKPTKSTTNRGVSNVTQRGNNQANIVSRTATTQNVTARAATQNQSLVTETRTGAAYETCKSAFFTCMDQFCALKNDDYRRCSCSSRVDALEKQRKVLVDAGEQLTIFTENLDVVGLTAAQATAMRTASEGENALASDTSASKALLQAIMNSISGGDTSVGGKYSDLNTINMSYDLSTAFGSDANQIIASYNGQELYSAVYPQCRHAVADDCNTASLQRAVNAYLMAIEQDCNTVQTAIQDKQAQTKAAIRESSAMLDLARVENRRKHNSDDITTCINNVEAAILSEEVCGANYHKCLDNGEFIDLSTGAPIVGVVKFYELGNLLTFAPGVDAANQQLSKRPNNRTFVLNFEKRTKKFAKPALDKCTDIADVVWSEYLDKAMLAIYYAQQSKVSEIKQGCFDFVSKCYMNSDTSITSAMSELIGSGLTILEPDKIALTTKMCTEYVESCNNMFNQSGTGNIIEQYVNTRQDTDTLTACRAIVKQCFDKYGGSGYENFYYPYSGLFEPGNSASQRNIKPGDWFTLYDLTGYTQTKYKSPCANELENIDACKNIVEEAFGGFDLMYTKKDSGEQDQLSFTVLDDTQDTGTALRYGIQTSGQKMRNRVLRPTGVATEVYNQIIDTLTTQCSNIKGQFVERQFIKENIYGGKNKDNICLWYPQGGNAEEANPADTSSSFKNYKILATLYGIFTNANQTPEDESEETEDNTISIPENFIGENMCPRDYNLNVDTAFWGACLCWENGGRRSKNGRNATCVAELPVAVIEETDETTGETTKTHANDSLCYKNVKTISQETGTEESSIEWLELSDATSSFYDWCIQPSTNSNNQVCPYGYTEADSPDNTSKICVDSEGKNFADPTTDYYGAYRLLPEAMK